MKKIVLFIVFLSFIFGLAACNKEVDFNLESPANLKITNGVLSWDSVEEADHYLVFIDQTEVKVSLLTYDLKKQSLAVGSYTVSVVAVKDDKLSLPSNVLTYVVIDPAAEVVEVPKNVKIVAGVVSWDAVVGATSYLVHVGTMNFTVTTTTVDLKTKSIPEGTHAVYVNTVKGSKSSANSQNVSYVVETSIQQNDIREAVLKLMNPTYVQGLGQGDFSDSYEYNAYLNAVDMVDAYAAFSMSAGMSKTNAISFVTDLMEMTTSMPQEMTLDAMMTQLDIFNEYDMDAADLANMLYELLLVGLDVNVRDLENEILYIEEEIEDRQAILDDIILDADYIAEFNYVKSFATPSQYEAVEMLFAGEYYSLTNSIYQITQDVLYGFGFIDPNDYGYESMDVPGYVSDLLSVFTAMNQVAAGRDFLNNIYLVMGDVSQATDYRSWIKEDTFRIAESEEEIVMAEALKQSFVDNREDVIGSLQVVLEFVFTLKDSMPQNVIDLLDEAMTGETLTMIEMMLIKNELALLLRTALPEASDFELVYKTVFVLGGTFADTDLTLYMNYATKLGQAHYLTADLFLTIIEDVNLLLVTNAIAILDDAKDDMGYYDFENNPEVMIDFALYVIDYLETFASENQGKVDALKNLITDDDLESIYVMVIDLAIDEITNDEYMDTDEKAIALELLEGLKLNFDAYKAVYDKFGEKASDVLRYVIDSEARIFKTLINMSMTPNNEMNLLFTNIALLIEDIHMIDNQLFSSITTVELDILLNAAKLPLKAALKSEDPSIDFDALYTALTPKIKTVLLNVVSLQASFMVQADALDLAAIVTNENLSAYNIGVFIAIIEALDKTLTTANKTLIIDTINLVFDDIFGNVTVRGLMGATAQEVNDTQADVLEEFNTLSAEIKALALLDENNLAENDPERIINLMIDLGLYFDFPEDLTEKFITASPLTLDQTKNVSYIENNLYFTYTALESGAYMFSSTSTTDPFVNVYNLYGDMIDYADDSYSGNDFELMFYLMQGETYYFEVAAYDSNVSFDILLEKITSK